GPDVPENEARRRPVALVAAELTDRRATVVERERLTRHRLIRSLVSRDRDVVLDRVQKDVEARTRNDPLADREAGRRHVVDDDVVDTSKPETASVVLSAPGAVLPDDIEHEVVLEPIETLRSVLGDEALPGNPKDDVVLDEAVVTVVDGEAPFLA